MKRKGFTLVELLIVIAIIALLMSILMPALAKVRQIAQQVVCGSNCKGIGTAMAVYAGDDKDQGLPIAGREPNDYGGSIMVNTNGSKSRLSCTRSLWLLVKGDFVSVEQFICKGDAGVTPPTLRDMPRPYNSQDLAYYDDFGANRDATATNANLNPGRHCSYAYHAPNQGDSSNHTLYLPSTTAGADFALLADKNPYIKDKNIPVSSDYDKQNCLSHQKNGQNVLYADMHVLWAKKPTVGINEDNIYTYWEGDEAADKNNEKNHTVGIKPIYKSPECYPKSKKDSILLSEEFQAP